MEDFVQVASLAFWVYLQKFDTTRGVKFITYMWRCVSGTLLRERKRARLICTPGSTGEAEEVFKRTARVTSLDYADDDERSLLDTMSDGYSLVDDVSAREDVAHLRAAIGQLPDRLRTVLTLRLAGHTLQAIGDRLGVSKERIRQIEMDAREEVTARMQDRRSLEVMVFEAAISRQAG